MANTIFSFAATFTHGLLTSDVFELDFSIEGVVRNDILILLDLPFVLFVRRIESEGEDEFHGQSEETVEGRRRIVSNQRNYPRAMRPMMGDDRPAG